MRVGKNDMVVGYGLQLFILGGPEEAVSQLQKRPVPPSYLWHLCPSTMVLWVWDIKLSAASSQNNQQREEPVVMISSIWVLLPVFHMHTNYSDCNTFLSVYKPPHIYFLFINKLWALGVNLSLYLTLTSYYLSSLRTAFHNQTIE